MAVEDLPLLERAEVCIEECTMPPLVRRTLSELKAEVERLRPRQIETVEELDALPSGSVIRVNTNRGLVFEKWRSSETRWHQVGTESSKGSERIHLPALLIWTPKVQ